jgi:peptide/nickel transport system substrate-binding protein
MLALTAACGPASTSGPKNLPSSDLPAAPKRLTIGILEEPRGWAPGVGATTAGGAHQPRWLVTRTLTVIDDRGAVQPELAISVPSVERGDWQINPDGTMEQTWRLKPGLRWHDGQPLTAQDFVFGWEVETHPAIPQPNSLARFHITSASAPDPHTLILHFRGTTPLAGDALYDPYPRHLLGEQLAQDAEQFPRLEFWTTAYVGAGPYRLADWQLGAFQTFTAFADYVGGKPKLDTVTIKFLQDPNALLANVLGGEVDVALPDGLGVETAADLRRGWAASGSGNGVILFPDGRVYRVEFQHRPEYAQPSAARDPRVRRAFAHTIDKDAVNEVELVGLGVLADSWIPPDDPRRPRFTDAIPEWSHDVARAQRILEEAGWRRGGDGVLIHGATGQRLETDIRVTGGQGHVRALAVMANEWRKVGAAVTETVIPAALLNNGEYRSTFPFAGLTGHPITLQWEYTHYSCRREARPETRWSGNRNGYCNPTIEPLVERLEVTITERERTALQTEIMRAVNREDYAQIYLYWQVTPVVHSKGITGLGPLSPGPHGGAQSPWNIHLWDKQ